MSSADLDDVLVFDCLLVQSVSKQLKVWKKVVLEL
jgi:hypothetical protein